jgi:hypothetical protein
MCSGGPLEQPDLVPFWFRPFSIFGLLPITVFINSSHVLTLLTSLAIQPHDCLQQGRIPHGILPGLTPDLVVPEASDPAVTSNACSGRLQLME